MIGKTLATCLLATLTASGAPSPGGGTGIIGAFGTPGDSRSERVSVVLERWDDLLVGRPNRGPVDWLALRISGACDLAASTVVLRVRRHSWCSTVLVRGPAELERTTTRLTLGIRQHGADLVALQRTPEGWRILPSIVASRPEAPVGPASAATAFAMGEPGECVLLDRAHPLAVRVLGSARTRPEDLAAAGATGPRLGGPWQGLWHPAAAAALLAAVWFLSVVAHSLRP